MTDQIEIKRIKRNKYGAGTQNINVTLPTKTLAMVIEWAGQHNVTLSRAIHDLTWAGFYAERGEYKPYEER